MRSFEIDMILFLVYGITMIAIAFGFGFALTVEQIRASAKMAKTHERLDRAQEGLNTTLSPTQSEAGDAGQVQTEKFSKTYSNAQQASKGDVHA